MKTKTESATIGAIARRAHRMFPEGTVLDFAMDIEAAHENNPLKLGALLDADDFNFAHDIIGINQNLDRDTYKLLNNFVPRFSA